MEYKAERFEGQRNILTEFGILADQDRLGQIRINPTEFGQCWWKPLYRENWLHVDAQTMFGRVRRKEYTPLPHTQWNNRIIGYTHNVTKEMIQDVIDTHDSSKTEHPNLPIKFCVNVERCGNSFYCPIPTNCVMPPRWSLTERGYLCQACYELHKIAPETIIDLTKPGDRGPGKRRKVPSIPLDASKIVGYFGRGGRRRKNRKKRTKKGRKSKRKRRKSRRKKRRKSKRKKKS